MLFLGKSNHRFGQVRSNEHQLRAQSKDRFRHKFGTNQAKITWRNCRFWEVCVHFGYNTRSVNLSNFHKSVYHDRFEKVFEKLPFILGSHLRNSIQSRQRGWQLLFNKRIWSNWHKKASKWQVFYITVAARGTRKGLTFWFLKINYFIFSTLIHSLYISHRTKDAG